MLQNYLEPQAFPKTNWSMEAIDSQLEVATARFDQFDKLCATMEEVEEIHDDLERLIESGDANQTTAVMMRERIMRVEEDTGLTVEIPSMESHGDDMVAYHQISMEAISGIWNRIKQAYVAEFQMYLDALHTFFRGYRREGLRQMARAHKLRQEWADKKRDLHEKSHKASVAGYAVYRAFLSDGSLSRDPIAALNTDYKYAKYLCSDYHKDLAAYINKVKGILTSGKFDTDENFQSSVLAKLKSLQHPSTILKLDIIGKGAVLLNNNGLEMKKGRPQRPVSDGPDYKHLADLSVRTYCKEFIFSWSMLNSHVFHDLYLTTAQVDQLLDLTESYSKLMVDAVDSFKPLTRAISDMASFAKKNVEVDQLSETNRAAFKQLLRFARGLTRYSKTPYRVEIARVRKVAMGSRILASRTIATAQ